MLKELLSSHFLKKRWRMKNSHNKTHIVNVNHMSSVVVGNYSYGPIDIIKSDASSKLIIGNFCSIAEGVKFVLGADHNMTSISTYPFKVKILRAQEYEAVSKGDILIDDDVWIAYGSTILSGVHIHQGAVVAAGSVVTKDVPPYAIVGGVPAKIIRYRFSDEIISYLKNLDYSKLNEELISKHLDELYSSIDGISYDKVSEHFGWFPKK